MRRPSKSLVLPIVSATSLALVSTAAADSQTVVSQPHGDFELSLTVASTTDKDRDGNRATATKPDKLLIHHQVCSRFQREQTVDLTITIDRPGAEFDEQTTAVGDLVTFTCHQQFIEDKVGNKWPPGTYTVTIDAVNDSGDTARASASIVIS